MKKQRKKLVIVAIIIVLGLFLLCNTSWGKEHILYPSAAEQNAIKYIKEKYGFRPRVTSVEIHVYDNSGSPVLVPHIVKPLKEATLEMEYEGKEFKTFISWGDTKEAYDTYQHDVIEAAVKQRIAEVMGETARVDFTCGWSSIFYSGENLVEVLESTWHGTNTADIYTVNAELSDLSYDEMVKNFGNTCRYSILNCIDWEGFKKIDALETDRFLSSLEVEKYALYIKDYIQYSKNFGEDKKHYEMGQYDNIYYQFINGTYCNIEKRNIEDLSEWDENGRLEDYLLSDRYIIDTDAQEMLLFVPCEEFGIDEERQVMIIELYTKEGSKTYQGMSENRIEDNKYISSNIILKNRSDISFVIGTK